MLGLGPWYDQLKVPWFQPPAWAFTPAWTTIFILLAFATHRVARLGSVARIALAVYAVQMILNILWSLFFFPITSTARVGEFKSPFGRKIPECDEASWTYDAMPFSPFG